MAALGNPGSTSAMAQTTAATSSTSAWRSEAQKRLVLRAHNTEAFWAGRQCMRRERCSETVFRLTSALLAQGSLHRDLCKAI